MENKSKRFIQFTVMTLLVVMMFCANYVVLNRQAVEIRRLRDSNAAMDAYIGNLRAYIDQMETRMSGVQQDSYEIRQRLHEYEANEASQ